MLERKTAERFARQQNTLLTRLDASPALSALREPALLLCCRQDSWASVKHHKAIQLLAPDTQLSVIKDAGHMVLMDQPEASISASSGD